jgi:hypothetical protein
MPEKEHPGTLGKSKLFPENTGTNVAIWAQTQFLIIKRENCSIIPESDER